MFFTSMQVKIKVLSELDCGKTQNINIILFFSVNVFVPNYMCIYK